ncbi:hypothetical protein JM84_2159 [Dokdonia sp. Hel_I_63]|nr:hypothetical protein Krodi_2530 [Dokdonia sp. 4H-3-7-5]TVZ23237.1 hypothetical protein JM84_2159 [Dokdonia sp. Hel_I_63]
MIKLFSVLFPYKPCDLYLSILTKLDFMAVLNGLNRRLLLIAFVGGAIAILLIYRNQTTTSPEVHTAEDLLEKVMNASGTKERYKNIKSIRFEKAFHLYHEDGTVEIDRTELHQYDFSDGTQRNVSWSSDTTNYELIQKDSDIYQTINGATDTTATKVSLQNKLNAATFVLGLPYTLNTDNSTKTYNGLQDFEGVRSHELVVTFTGSEDVWSLYYEPKTFAWLGYWVQTSDHYSLVINDEMTEVDEFQFSRKRSSYRTDSLKVRQYLRADYDYSNYEIK